MIHPRDLGERLRQLRVARQLSLHEVQNATRGEFKASALGAYERGQRALTIQRLDRLAAVYGVDVTSLLADETSIDLVLEAQIDAEDAKIEPRFVIASVTRFEAWVRQRRRNTSPGPLRVRRSDSELIATLFALNAGVVEQILAGLDLQNRAAGSAPALPIR